MGIIVKVSVHWWGRVGVDALVLQESGFPLSGVDDDTSEYVLAGEFTEP